MKLVAVSAGTARYWLDDAIQERRRSMKYYKVLLHGRSCHGGDAEWSLPKQREDGTWEPGEWMPKIRGPLELCANGYHLTREPARWWREGAECYVAEWDGEHVGDGDGGDKIAVRRCRLLRKLSNGELAALRIFADGRHVVTGGFAVASGSALVEARDSARVWAFGSARVEAFGSARVEAFGSARVEAHGSAQVWAHGYAKVEAYGSAKVEAYGFVKVEAYGSAKVEAYNSATVEARGSAQVTTVWGQPTVTVEERA